MTDADDPTPAPAPTPGPEPTPGLEPTRGPASASAPPPAPAPAPPPGPSEPVPVHAETGGSGDPVEIAAAVEVGESKPRRSRYHGDDSLMNRFDRDGLRRFRARDGIVAVLVSCALMVVFAGASVKHAGQQLQSRVGRNVVLAFGDPAAKIADALPISSVVNKATSWLSPDANLSSAGGGFATISSTSAAGPGGIPPVTADAFDPTKLGLAAPPKRPLHTLLVTGDSMSEPLDSDLAESLEPNGIHVIQDPHIGTGISQTVLLDWGKEATAQVKQYHPDAVVIFIGANDGFSMPGPGGAQVSCCTAEWAAIYAERARSMMNTYRQDGVARVYWLTLPAPRDSLRAQISRVVDYAVTVAAQPWADQVRIIDMVPVFTPGFVYRDAMTVNGQPTIVRESDGIHLNDAGSQLAANIVQAAIDKDFTTG
jgi:lysophospholipase L1-like esterase